MNFFDILAFILDSLISTSKLCKVRFVSVCVCGKEVMMFDLPFILNGMWGDLL